MQLGSAISPLPPRQSDGFQRAVDAYLAERGDSAALLQQTLEQIVALTATLGEVVQALLAQAPPVVNVSVPEVETEAPVVNVTVTEPEEKPTRKRVVRDAQGLIDYIIEETI